MNKAFLAFIVGLSVLVFTSTSRAETYKCEGTVRTLMAMSTRQIWINVEVRLKPFSAPSAEAAKNNAALKAKAEVEQRETTVEVVYARMTCVALPSETKAEPKPLTTIAPVKIAYKWRCWVKTTWHVGARSGTIERHDVEVTTDREDAEGMAMGLAILQVQERAKVLLFGKKDKPTWSATDAKCTY